jgi:hypothetical protein
LARLFFVNSNFIQLYGLNLWDLLGKPEKQFKKYEDKLIDIYGEWIHVYYDHKDQCGAFEFLQKLGDGQNGIRYRNRTYIRRGN